MFANESMKAKYEADKAKFTEKLSQNGLKSVEMSDDGNCLFRAIADQLEGNQILHRKYRQKAVDQMRSNKDEYAAFVEDDQPIDEYLEDIEDGSLWGGQLEIQALSDMFKFNYIVHQVDIPNIVSYKFPLDETPTIHLSYHLGKHYNSVRLINDPCKGLPIHMSWKQK